MSKKNLVYFSVFYNRDYFRLADLLIKSMRQFSSTDQFDLLILTAPEFSEQVSALAAILPLRIFYIPLTTIFQAACARLRIFAYPDIDQYDTILYLDTDIIIKKDLAPLFTAFPGREVLYGLESGTVSSYSFGRQFFDLSVINPNTTAINSGTLMFRNCQVIRDLFWRIMAHVDRYVGQPPACMDQPFINYHAIKDGIYDNQWLNPHVSLYEDCDPVTNYETSSICHFSFPIGNWSHKFGRMAAFFKGLLLHKTEGASVEEKQLSWGKDGWIRFESDGRLVTMWGIGTYECLGDTRILAVWHDHHHVLQKMDNGAYCSIRIQPLDFSTVVCKSSNLIIYGNSHARSLFYNCKLPCINYWKYSITMHRIGRDNTIIDFQKSDPTAIFCLVYGEVDVRCHIGKQVALGRSVDEICQTLTDAYFRTIKNTIVEYRAIVVIGVPPPVDPIDHSHTHESGQDIPFIGSNEERVLYTRTLNACLKKACVEYGYTFFAHYDYCTRADGCLDYSFADGCIHIGKTEPFLEAFYALRL